MTTYTVLAYRPEGTDSCRGNVYARSDSAFEYKIYYNLLSTIDYWASKLFESKTSDRQYSEWELVLLFDGLDAENWYGMESKDSPPYYNMDELARPRLEELLTKHRAELAVKEEAALQARKAQLEAAERAEFIRLAQKFANQGS